MIKVKHLTATARTPTRATSGAGAFDLYASEDALILPVSSAVIGTGIALEIPVGWMGVLSHRSSMAFKLDCIASLGFIDADYRGEVKVKLFNLGNDGVHIKAGDRIAQIAFIETYQGNQLGLVEGLTETRRGTSGLGSTGA